MTGTGRGYAFFPSDKESEAIVEEWRVKLRWDEGGARGRRKNNEKKTRPSYRGGAPNAAAKDKKEGPSRKLAAKGLDCNVLGVGAWITTDRDWPVAGCEMRLSLIHI